MSHSHVVVVTRHPALVEYLRENDLIGDDVEVISHASVDQIKGKNVIGVLPLRLAKETLTITEVPLNIPAELRGQELSLDQIRQYAGEVATYVVSEL